MNSSFHVLDDDPQRGAEAVRAAFEAQRPPVALSDHQAGAPNFRPDQPLLLAINAAIAVGAPLLLTGEPGTGKTQVAYWIAHRMALRRDERFFVLPVQSTTTADALRYHFDNVAYFHKAYEQKLGAGGSVEPIDKGEFVRPGVLWRALEAPGRALVLIDEIDKAPRDFPNDLLHVLDQYEIEVQEVPPNHSKRRVRLAQGQTPPLIVITSNSERRLPEPFLRRCVFHALSLDPETVRRAVDAHMKGDEVLGETARAAAIEHFLRLRKRELRKKPSTAELLVWLTLLRAGGVTAEKLSDRVPARDLPFLGALLKDQDDLAALRER